MNKMLENHILKKILTFNFIVLVVFILYLFSANFLFDQLLTVERESQIVNTNLPNESKNIRYNFDKIDTDKSGWKEFVTITGWAYIEGQNAENSSILLVFINDSSRYVFSTRSIMRPDVTKYYINISENKLNLNNSGFEANVPKVLIENKEFKMGILIKNETAQRYIITKNYCINGNCSYIRSRIT